MHIHVRMVMMMVMHMLIFLFTVDHYMHMGSGNAALLSFLGNELYIRNTDGIQFGNNRFGIIHQFKQSSCQHITGSTHSAVKVKCFHLVSSCCNKERSAASLLSCPDLHGQINQLHC